MIRLFGPMPEHVDRRAYLDEAAQRVAYALPRIHRSQEYRALPAALWHAQVADLTPNELIGVVVAATDRINNTAAFAALLEGTPT